jgi:excisionase family DNA binding protein
MSAGGPRVRYLTVAEVAEVMRLSRMTVYRFVQRGDLPAVRVGRSYRVPADALEAYLAAAEVLSDDAAPREDENRLSS